jgi:hypothetical protein
MYSRAGGYALGARVRSSHQGWIDRTEAGFSTSAGVPGDRGESGDAGAWTNLWFSVENPTLRRSGPLAGVRLATWYVDEVVRVDLSKRWDKRRFLGSSPATRTIGARAILMDGLTYLDPDQWEDRDTWEAFLDDAHERQRPSGWLRLRSIGTVGNGDAGVYARLEVTSTTHSLSRNGRWAFGTRAFVGKVTDAAPRQRMLRLSSQDPVTTFDNHFLRPVGSPLARPEVHYTPYGGGGLRGYDPRILVAGIGSAGLEGSRRLVAFDSLPGSLALWASVFGDVAYADLRDQEDGPLGGAGVGLAIRGLLFDRPLTLRFDAPLYVSRAGLGIDAGSRDERIRPRWTFSFTDLW